MSDPNVEDPVSADKSTADQHDVPANSQQPPSQSSAPVPAEKKKQARWGVAAVLICALVAIFWPADDGPRPAPPGMLVDDGGRPITLANRKSTVTLIHFWSTWCPPCLDEVPSILKLEEELRSEHHFSLIMIAVDDDTEKVRTFLHDDIGKTLFDHDWKVTKSYGTDKLPETYLVVKDEIVHKFVGATDWQDPKTRRRIDEALAQVKSEQQGV